MPAGRSGLFPSRFSLHHDIVNIYANRLIGPLRAPSLQALPPPPWSALPPPPPLWAAGRGRAAPPGASSSGCCSPWELSFWWLCSAPWLATCRLEAVRSRNLGTATGGAGRQAKRRHLASCMTPLRPPLPQTQPHLLPARVAPFIVSTLRPLHLHISNLPKPAWPLACRQHPNRRCRQCAW